MTLDRRPHRSQLSTNYTLAKQLPVTPETPKTKSSESQDDSSNKARIARISCKVCNLYFIFSTLILLLNDEYFNLIN